MSTNGSWLSEPGLAPWRVAATEADLGRGTAPRRDNARPATNGKPPGASASPTGTAGASAGDHNSSAPAIPAADSATGTPSASPSTPGVDWGTEQTGPPVAHPSPSARTLPKPARGDALVAARDLHPEPAAFRSSDVIRSRRARPDGGWRGAVYTLSGGWCNPGLSGAQAHHRRQLQRVRTHLPGTHVITSASMKGGVGKTTLTAVLGLTLAEHRGDRVIALDANPDAGTLADRLSGHVGITIRDLINNLDTIRSWTDIAHYTSLTGRLQVLASEQDPAMSEAFNRDEYQAVVARLTDFYSILLTDSGTGVVHSAMNGALAHTNTLVIAATPTVDGASRASKTLDWLTAHGYPGLVERAVVALSHDRTSRWMDHHALREHFNTRCHAVIDIPADPHLALGGLIELDALRPRTRDAYLELAACVAEQFAWDSPAHHANTPASGITRSRP